MRIFEILGVKYVRRLVLFAEKIKHLGDGRKNENYHPKDTSLCTLRSFSGYLIYNSLFHMAALILAAVCFVLIKVTDTHVLGYYIALGLAALFNIYCLMLQIYTSSKIKAHISKLTDRRNKQIQKFSAELCTSLKGRDGKEVTEEFSLVEKLKKCTEEGGELFLKSEDCPVLERIGERISFEIDLPVRVNTAVSKKDDTNKKYLPLEKNVPLDTKIKKTASLLQRITGMKKSENLLFEYCIITENKETEKAFRKIFAGTSRDSFEMMTEILFVAYGNAVKEEVSE